MIDLFNKKKLKEIQKEKNYYEKVCENKNKTINDINEEKSQLNKTLNNLISGNKKLINWIEKIINEVGVKAVDRYEGYTINIPYYEETHTKPYCAANNNWTRQEEKIDIIIPSIRFTKFRYKED